jgi:hypothetical protein
MTLEAKVVKPSPSYQIRLPQAVCERLDERVTSFWVAGAPLLLQLSSYIRHEGTQVGAQDRLRERIQNHEARWKKWEDKIHPDRHVDEATAEFVDQDGILWIHSYLVWPHLTVYSIISGPKKEVGMDDNWAIEGLRSIRLTTN